MISARNLMSGPRVARVLDDVSLEVRAGECVGLTGGAGAGCRTLLQILAGLREAQSGAVHLRGESQPAGPCRLRESVAYATADLVVAHGLRVDEYLRFVTGIKMSRPRAVTLDAASRVGLDPASSVARLSGAERAALAIAAALVATPEIVLVDTAIEAIGGEHRGRALAWLEETRQRGAAIFIAGSDAIVQTASCSRILRLENGHLVATAHLAATTDGADARHAAAPEGRA